MGFEGILLFVSVKAGVLDLGCCFGVGECGSCVHEVFAGRGLVDVRDEAVCVCRRLSASVFVFRLRRG